MPAIACWFAVLALLAPPVGALAPDKAFHDYVLDRWSVEHGLPQISVLAMAQDSQGYLWVGTQVGLARFDGNRFTVFRSETEPALPGGWINALLVDRLGTLWIGTYKGLAMRRDGRFSEVLPADAEGGASVPDIAALALDVQGLLVASGNALYRVREGRLVEQQRFSGPARAVYVDGAETWVGSLGGAYHLAPGTAAAPRFIALPTQAAAATVEHLTRAQGRLWAGTSSGLFWLDGGRWEPYTDAGELASVSIEGLLEDADGNLWVAELAHLTRLRDGRPVERVVDGDAGLALRVLFEDREGNLWLGSQSRGLGRLQSGWTRRFSRRQGLDSPMLWSLAKARDGGLWVGSDNGLYAFAKGHFSHVLPGSALPHAHAYTLLEEDGLLWIGTRGGLAQWRDAALIEPMRFSGLRGAQVSALLRDRQGALWLGTSQGLYRDDGKQLHRYDEESGLLDARVRHLLETRDGRLLVGTQSGPHERRGEHFVPLGLDRGLPPGLDITAQHELPDGRLVVGSLDESLFYFDGERWINFSDEDGVPRSAPFFITDAHDMLWVTGIRGIYRVPLKDLSAFAAGSLARVRGQMLINERGDRRGGHQGYCCNGAGLAKGLVMDGAIWAPSRDGVVALDMEDVHFPRRPSSTLVERWRIGERWEPFGQSGTTLPLGERDLAFEFTAISFQDPRSLGFRYRLSGYHEDWREPAEAGSRIASYTNLGPGSYHFEVQASVAEGEWGDTASATFQVPPRFVETWGFRALIGLLVALVGLALFWLQRRRFARRAEALEALIQARTADLAEANRQLSEASLTDPLTNLRNRRYLSQQIPKDLAFYGRELQRNPGLGQVIVFALIDIDHFKRVNDQHGHAAGDRVLEQFAEVLQAQVRNGDYVARWGGEEFMVVFRPTPSEYVPLLGERLCRACEDRVFDLGNGRSGKVTCSLGLVEYPLFSDAKTSLDWEQLVELADRALYRVKRAGRNGWGAYRPRPGVSMAGIIEGLGLDDEGFAQLSALRFVGTYGESAND